MNYFTIATIIGWVFLFGYWGYKARRVKKAVYSQNRGERALYLFLMFSSFALLYWPNFGVAWLQHQLIPENFITGLTGMLISFAGVLFAIWARTILADNWSGNITLKENHALIKSGPYSIVRHPIYTGFEIAFLGAAVTVGEIKCFLAILIIFGIHNWKIRQEEEIMRKQFPSEYPDYAQRVKRLIPYIY